VDTAQISPPWGYRQVIPLLRHHRVRLTETGMAPTFCLGLHAVPLGASEFASAVRDYPIVFQRRDSDGVFEAMAILGIERGQNLFVLPDGRWDRRTYMPAYIRRYPFYVSAPALAVGDQRAERVICVDPQSVADNGEPLFDETGAPLQHWTVFERLLNEYEDELARVHQLGELLFQIGALSPFSLHADLFSGFSLSLNDMYRVDRDKLATLDAQPLRELIAKRHMDLIYCHLLSQENFLRLVTRRSFFGTRAAA
jgi:hypothetical protein